MFTASHHSLSSELVIHLTVCCYPAIPLSGSEENHDALWCMYTILVMAVYWIFECLPLPITSLLPLGKDRWVGVLELLTLYFSVAAPVRSCQHGRGVPQLPEQHQHDVRGQPDHVHSRGALRVPQEAESAHHLRHRDQWKVDHARLHVLHDVPLYVDLQHGSYGPDGADSGLRLRGNARDGRR